MPSSGKGGYTLQESPDRHLETVSINDFKRVELGFDLSPSKGGHKRHVSPDLHPKTLSINDIRMV